MPPPGVFGAPMAGGMLWTSAYSQTQSRGPHLFGRCLLVAWTTCHESGYLCIDLVEKRWKRCRTWLGCYRNTCGQAVVGGQSKQRRPQEKNYFGWRGSRYFLFIGNHLTKQRPYCCWHVRPSSKSLQWEQDMKAFGLVWPVCTYRPYFHGQAACLQSFSALCQEDSFTASCCLSPGSVSTSWPCS